MSSGISGSADIKPDPSPTDPAPLNEPPLPPVPADLPEEDSVSGSL